MLSIEKRIENLQGVAEELLCKLIEFKSTAGNEPEVQEFLKSFLEENGLHPEYSSINESISSDSDYTFVPGHISYAGRNNIVLNIKGSGGGRSLIINSHSDVVPAPEEMFKPKIENGCVFGRGACDAKGQVVAMLLPLLALKESGAELKGDLQIQIVIEEETGGNGSLSLLLGGSRADAAVILEPTNLKVHPANRGAVWFKLAVSGKSVHMGEYWNGVNAIKEMVKLIGILERYETYLQEESAGNPLFPSKPSPVNVNIGHIKGGEWPSMVAGECFIEGGIAFLPNRRIKEIYNEVKSRIEAEAGEWAKNNFTFEFTRLHNEAFETPVDHPAVQVFLSSAEPYCGAQQPTGWNASCDARLFYHKGGMPTIVFGPGELSNAHSLQENIKISDILKASKVLFGFIANWCGVSKT